MSSKKSLLEIARGATTKQRKIRTKISDEEVVDLLFAYTGGVVDAVGIKKALRSYGYAVQGSNSISSLLGSRLITLLRNGKLKIKK